MNRKLRCLIIGGLGLFAAVLQAAEIPKTLFTPLPAPKNSGFHMDGYWIWDPSEVQGPDGKWEFFATRWPKNHPFHPLWLLSSEIVRAEGDKPEGPFTFKEVVFSARGPGYWDGRSVFNPRVQKIMENGKPKYVMFYVGTTHPFGDVKDDEKIEMNDPRVIVARSNKRIGVAVADDPRGPWKRFDQPLMLPRPGHFDDFFTSNPAAVFRADGSVFLMYKTRRYEGADKDFTYGPMTIGAAVAPNFMGPYRRLTDEPLFSPEKFGEVEDPFVYEKDGILHMIAKDMTGQICGEKHGGVHAVSSDGAHWKLGNPIQAWSRTVQWDDGATQVMGSFERPYILFQNGVPAYLLGATADGPGGFQNAANTWDIVIPLKTAP